MAKSRSKNKDRKSNEVFDIDMSSGFDDTWKRAIADGMGGDGKTKSDGWFSMRELLEEQSKNEKPLKLSALKGRVAELKQNGGVEVAQSNRFDAAGRRLVTPVYKFRNPK